MLYALDVGCTGTIRLSVSEACLLSCPIAALLLHQDLFYTTILAALMGYTKPCKSLARAKPVGRVLSPPLIIPLVLQLVVVIIFQVGTHMRQSVQHSLLMLCSPGTCRSTKLSRRCTFTASQNIW